MRYFLAEKSFPQIHAVPCNAAFHVFPIQLNPYTYFALGLMQRFASCFKYFQKYTPTQVASPGVTNAHGPLPQLTTSMSPSWSLLTAIGSN